MRRPDRAETAVALLAAALELVLCVGWVRRHGLPRLQREK